MASFVVLPFALTGALGLLLCNEKLTHLSQHSALALNLHPSRVIRSQCLRAIGQTRRSLNDMLPASRDLCSS